MVNLFKIFSAVDAQNCSESFLGLPHWYKYLEVQKNFQYVDEGGTQRVIDIDCVPQISGLNDFWLIGLALIELLTRIAVLVAIIYVLYAGIKYSESRGNTDKATTAKNTLVDAVTGLLIALTATALISFLGGRFAQ